ncbi:hypothetical protein EL17_20765 [Anditalea andensis]|uniref:Uncharacterized protein n=1 Tax=Anditalea andensis TaxID=1048983 RepID=A0A074KPR6_9BACT|nr:hypothetical protein EL17_20765 [Anditalea andensis]
MPGYNDKLIFFIRPYIEESGIVDVGRTIFQQFSFIHTPVHLYLNIKYFDVGNTWFTQISLSSS